jgi:hypothetical protein
MAATAAPDAWLCPVAGYTVAVSVTSAVMMTTSALTPSASKRIACPTENPVADVRTSVAVPAVVAPFSVVDAYDSRFVSTMVGIPVVAALYAGAPLEGIYLSLAFHI